jgi:chromatin segregation and condensation protein Rec8/ScpA/Scc1 (kleisin family)
MRKAFEFAGVDPDFTSEQFDREWEKSTAKESDKYQFMEKLVRLPGFRSFDRNFDRLPERARWMVEKVVHDPDKPSAPKPALSDEAEARIKGCFTADVAALKEFAGRDFAGWRDYSA